MSPQGAPIKEKKICISATFKYVCKTNIGAVIFTSALQFNITLFTFEFIYTVGHN